MTGKDTRQDSCVDTNTNLTEPVCRFGYEKASERWLPIHTVETILISVISMLAGAAVANLSRV